ncbi:MAG TPA: hypothetical protein VH518_24050 [Tepidisphaeraceae bacterium]|jgi:hypothetical protein
MSKTRQQTVRILFIGNSFTARNNLPGLISELAAARGLNVETRLLSIGGASLRTHWNKGDALAAIKSGKFDFVVLQEQSTLPIKNAARMRENVLLFDEAIRAGGSRTVLYMTWTRKHTPKGQHAITEAYTSIGKEIHGIVVPVGEVWQQFIRQHDSPALYDKDQSHPTLAGSFLAACVFLTHLLGQSPVGIKISTSGLNAESINQLQRAAAALPKR